MTQRKVIGKVTAYAAAVEGGYKGTYEEFCAEQANFATSAQTVAGNLEESINVLAKAEDVRDEANNIKDEIEKSKQAAVDSAEAAKESETNAGESATNANESARAAKASADSAADSAASAVAARDTAVASAEELAGKTAEVGKSTATIAELNCRNFMDEFSLKVETTTAGITFTENPDGSVTVSGTATKLALANYWSNTAALPEWIEKGKSYRAKYASANVKFVVWFYKGGKYATGTTMTSDRAFLVPSDAEGAVIRLQVESGTTVDETVKPIIVDTLTNAELAESVQTSNAELTEMVQTSNAELTEMVRTVDTAIAANTKAVGKATAAIAELNCHNFLDELPLEVVTATAGITFTENPDGSVTVSGTATKLALANYWADKSALPAWLEKDKVCRIKYSSSNVKFAVWFYKDGAYLSGVTAISDKKLKVPADAEGAVIRLQVENGVTVNETVKPIIVDTLTNAELEKRLGDKQNNDIYPLDKTFYAFGDSLFYGALWNGDAENLQQTRAAVGSRIPDRIANRVRCKNYINFGVGGMAITKAGSTTPKFIDFIKSKDITKADLIVFMGGRNDGGSSLGTSESTSADGTICGGIKEIIEYIRGVNPTCQLVVIQTTPYTSANDPWKAEYGTDKWTLDRFDYEVSQICKDMCVGYCSWYGCSLFAKWSDLSGGGGNYAHMREAKGYEQMGDFIAGQVAGYFAN